MFNCLLGLVSVFILAFTVTPDNPADLRGTLLKVENNDTLRIDGARVFLLGVPGEISYTEVHESQLMDQVNQTFTPHILTTLIGESVTFQNSDPVNHNVRLSQMGEEQMLMNKMTYPGQSVSYTFKKKGVVSVQCDMHPSMQAYIPVLGKPYLQSRTNREGAFSFDLPDSLADRSYTIRAWDDEYGWSDEQQVSKSSGHASSVTLHFK